MGGPCLPDTFLHPVPQQVPEKGRAVMQVAMPQEAGAAAAAVLVGAGMAAKTVKAAACYCRCIR